jgi:hypothetical protein
MWKYGCAKLPKQVEGNLRRIALPATMPDVLEQFYGNRQRQETASPEDFGGEEGGAAEEEGGSPGTEGVPAAEAPAEEDFQLTGVPKEEFKPQQFEGGENTRQSTFITGIGTDLPGQEAMLDVDGVRESATKGEQLRPLVTPGLSPKPPRG